MKSVALSKVAKIIMGQSPPSSTYNAAGEGLPFFQGKADFGDLYPTVRMYCSDPQKVADVDDILISVRAPVGPTNICPGKSCIGRGLAAIRSLKDLDSRYLLYFLRFYEPELAEAGKGSTFSAISRSDLELVQIPLPPLPEQQRIAVILGRADRLRRLRRTARELGDTYLESTFVHLFGDPGINRKEWDVASVEEILSKDRRGTQTGPFGSSLKRHEYVEEGIPVWGIDNIRENEFVERGSLFITPAKYRELSRYIVEDSDILVSRAGTIGRMCVAHPTQHPSIIGTNLVRVVVDTSAVLPEYFTALFTYFLDRVGNMSSGGTAYSFINPRTLKSLEIPIPPIALQRQFAHIVHKFERLRAQQREAERQAEHLFQALLHRAFRGEM